MDKQKYLAQRKSLIQEAQDLINENKIDEAKAKNVEIKNLDTAFENAAKVQADINALNELEPVNLENQSIKIKKQGQSIALDKTPDNEDAAYKNAFGAYLMNKTMTDEQQEIFDKVNSEFRNATQTTTSNGVVIPTTLQSEIFKKMANLHPILSDIKDFGTKGNMTIAVDESSNPSDEPFYDEDTETKDDDLQLGEIELSGYELSRAVKVSWKLKKMSIDSYLDYVVGKIAERMGDALACAIINGKGVAGSSESFKSQPTGIITALKKETNKPQIVEVAEIAEADIRILISKIKSGYLAISNFYANNSTIWNDLAGLKDETGKHYFIPDVTSGGVGKLFGVTVKEEAAVPDSTLVLGAVARAYAFNSQEPYSIVQQEQAIKRRTDYVGYSIVDGKPIINEAFAVLIKK